MFANERYSVILDLINQNGSVAVAELVEVLHTSTETIRRDLLYLEREKLLQRVHGGAIAISSMNKFPSLTQRLNENNEQKEQLSESAALLLKEGDIIAIDAGSTAVEFVNILKKSFKNLTIVTHSVKNFDMIKSIVGFKSILIGGEYLQSEDMFYGGLAMETIQKLHVDLFFLFPSAVSLRHGVSDFIPESVSMQKAYLQIADKVVVMADSSKYEKNAFLKICNMNSSYTYITNSDLDDSIYKIYKNNNINLYRSKKELMHE
jgi:DeoR/GlpR family transcriptional regulator of sugar metabolism